MTRIGSLFSGYAGLEQGVQSVLGGTVAWHSEIDPGACKILAHRFPGVPNIGDVERVGLPYSDEEWKAIKQVQQFHGADYEMPTPDWSAVEPVDVLTGGFPCQDVSAAGKREGIRPGTRSGLWGRFADAIEQLHPPLVVIENVRGLLSADAHHPAHGDLELCDWCVGDGDRRSLRALGAVLGDLADLGYDANWQGLRAADVGAPHGRFRVFVTAWPAADAGGEALRLRAGLCASQPAGLRWGRPDDCGSSGITADAECLRLEARRRPSGLQAQESWNHDGVGALSAPAPHPNRDGLKGVGGLVPVGRDADGCGGADGDGDEAEPTTRGGELSGGSTEGRPGEALRDLRGADDPQAVQRSPRGSRGVPAPPVLRPELREHQGRGDEGRTPLACSSASRADVRGVLNDEGSTRPSRRSEPREQRPSEPADALLVVSSAAALAGGSGATAGRCEASGGYGCSAWGAYAPAVHRWEMVLGRLAPPATELSPKGAHRLSARAVEFLMGLPAGWVTDVPGLSRNDQLKALGNGVVPQQAAAALRLLLPDVIGAAA